ncbi:MAG TPA: hypothetical protein ENH91_07110 [Leeuwenhoekiella sp.]|nr:hypothetical protein [Leeuwenhoekiella sp.]
MKTKLLFSIFFISILGYAQDGTLDLDFGDGKGYVLTDYQNGDDGIEEFDIQDDGKFISVGYSYDIDNNQQILVFRNLPNGQLDLSFGTDGFTKLDFIQNGKANSIFDLSINKYDNKIYITGYLYDDNEEDNIDIKSEIFIIRLNNLGELDESFNENGILRTSFGFESAGPATSIVFHDDKKFTIPVAIGSINSQVMPALAKFNSDGSLDSSYGDNGISFFEVPNSDLAIIYSIILLDNGSILGTGMSYNFITETGDLLLFKMTSSGNLDLNFGSEGILLKDIDGLNTALDIDTGYNLAVQSDGKIIVAAQYDDEKLAIIRFLNNGTEDFTLIVLRYKSLWEAIMNARDY